MIKYLFNLSAVLICKSLYMVRIIIMIYSYSKHLVLCYINIGSGYICDYLPWSKDPSNGTTSDCSKHQAVNKNVALLLSIGSVFGLDDFYTGNFLDGVFALVQGVITILSILISLCTWRCSKCLKCFKCIRIFKIFSDITLTILLAICILSEITHMIINCDNSTEFYEIIYNIVTIILFFFTCYLRYSKFCRWCEEKHPKLSRRLMATLITIVVMLINTIVDFLLVWYDKRLDGNGCPFLIT